MQLLTDEIRANLPPLFKDPDSEDPMIYARFFALDSNWVWYLAQGEPRDDDFIFYGYIIGFEKGWGIFSLNELQSTESPFGLPVQRDEFFTPRRWSEVTPKREQAP